MAKNLSNILRAGGGTNPLQVANGGTGVTTLTGIAKGNGTSGLTAAVAGTDYLAPPAGTSLLKANSGGALVNAVAGTDYLEAVTPGTSGNVLTSNGTAWTSAAANGGASGGTTINGNVTLTNTSPAAMTTAPTVAGYYVTLPSALTCTKGSLLFSINNTGSYSYGIKNSAGTVLGWVVSGTEVMIGLTDNSSAEGNWSILNLSKVAVTAEITMPLSFTGYINWQSSATLDSNRIFHLFRDSTTGYLYGVVYNSNTNTWGTVTLIRDSATGGGCNACVLVSTDKVLVVSCGTTAMQATVLTFSDTVITVGTAASATLAENMAQLNVSDVNNLVAVNGSFVVLYTRASMTEVRAITVSGTTALIGSAVDCLVKDTSSAFRIFVSGTTARVLLANTSTIYCIPYTVSGTTITRQNYITTATSAAYLRKAYMNDNGNIVAIHVNAQTKVAIFKLTGLSESVSVATIFSSGFSSTNQLDFIPLNANKTLVSWGESNSSHYVNIITDTSGTATTGTALLVSNSIFNTSFILRNPTSLSSVNILMQNSNSVSEITRGVFNCTGSSATLVSLNAVVRKNGAFPYSIPFASGNTEYRYNRQIQIGSTTIYYPTDSYPNGCTIYGENNYFVYSPLPPIPYGDSAATSTFSGNAIWSFTATTGASKIVKIEGTV